MAKTATVEIEKISPEVVLKRIRARLEKIRGLERRADILRCHMFLDVYLWIEAMMARGVFTSLKAAYEGLAQTVKVSSSSIQKYYIAGRYMREEKFDPESVHAHSVMLLAQYEGLLTQDIRLKARQLVRKGEVGGAIARLIRKSRMETGDEVELRIRRLQREGEWTETRIRMEVMAMRTMLERFFGEAVEIAITSKETGEALL